MVFCACLSIWFAVLRALSVFSGHFVSLEVACCRFASRSRSRAAAQRAMVGGLAPAIRERLGSDGWKTREQTTREPPLGLSNFIQVRGC